METYERMLTEKKEELDTIRRHYSKHKIDTTAILMAKEETIEKLNQKWISIEHGLMKKEEDLKLKLGAIYNTQRDVIDKLKLANEKQLKIIRAHEDKLRCSRKEIRKLKENMSEELKVIAQLKQEKEKQMRTIKDHRDKIQLMREDVNLKEDIMTTYIQRTKFLENEITKLNDENEMNIDMIKKIQSEVNIHKEKIKELETERAALNEMNRKIESEKLEDSERLNRVIEKKRKFIEEKTKQIELLTIRTERIAGVQNEMNQLKKELEDVRRENEVLRELVHQSEASKAEEQNRIQVILNQQIKLVCEAYGREYKVEIIKVKEFIGSIGQDINKQIEGLENNLEKFDDLQKLIERLANFTNNTIEAQKRKTNERESQIESLQEMVVEKDEQIREMKEELNTKDIICNDLQQYLQKMAVEKDQHIRDLQEELNTSEVNSTTLKMSLQKIIVEKHRHTKELVEELNRKDIIVNELKQQMDDNFKVLQTEISKYDIDKFASTTTPETNYEAHENEIILSALDRILREIDRRNTVMTELQENVQMKHDALIRVEERYQRLTERVMKAVIIITDARLDYEELERENKRLKLSLKRKYKMDSVEEPTASDHERQGQDAGHTCQSCQMLQQHSNSQLLNTFCKVLDVTRGRSRKQEKHIVYVKNIEYLKAELQRERQLRKKHEALFTSVLQSLQCAQPDVIDMCPA